MTGVSTDRNTAAGRADISPRCTCAGARCTNSGLGVGTAEPGSAEGRFRTASPGNIALSGRCRHDGRFATLREVIEHDDTAVQRTKHLAGAMTEHPSGRAQPLRLNLSGVDELALEACLH